MAAIDVARFESKYEAVPGTGCWLWNASTDRAGYGQFRHDGCCAKSHRIAYRIYVGAIPAGMHVCHKCDTPACVNPAHLFLGTDATNHADRNRKGRVANGERHYMAKLTAEDVVAIRVAAGTQAEIAAKFGISASNVGFIKRRATWARINQGV